MDPVVIMAASPWVPPAEALRRWCALGLTTVLVAALPPSLTRDAVLAVVLDVMAPAAVVAGLSRNTP